MVGKILYPLICGRFLPASSGPPPGLLRASSGPPPGLLRASSGPPPGLLQRPPPEPLPASSRTSPGLLQNLSWSPPEPLPASSRTSPGLLRNPLPALLPASSGPPPGFLRPSSRNPLPASPGPPHKPLVVLFRHNQREAEKQISALKYFQIDSIAIETTPLYTGTMLRMEGDAVAGRKKKLCGASKESTMKPNSDALEIVQQNISSLYGSNLKRRVYNDSPKEKSSCESERDLSKRTILIPLISSVTTSGIFILPHVQWLTMKSAGR